MKTVSSCTNPHQPEAQTHNEAVVTVESHVSPIYYQGGAGFPYVREWHFQSGADVYVVHLNGDKVDLQRVSPTQSSNSVFKFDLESGRRCHKVIPKQPTVSLSPTTSGEVLTLAQKSHEVEKLKKGLYEKLEDKLPKLTRDELEFIVSPSGWCEEKWISPS